MPQTDRGSKKNAHISGIYTICGVIITVGAGLYASAQSNNTASENIGCLTKGTSDKAGISYPRNGSAIQREAAIQGKTPSEQQRTVKIAVYAQAEQKWYISDATTTGREFSGPIVLGRKDTDFGARYTVSAVALTDAQVPLFLQNIAKDGTYPGRLEDAPGFMCSITLVRLPKS